MAYARAYDLALCLESITGMGSEGMNGTFRLQDVSHFRSQLCRCSWVTALLHKGLKKLIVSAYRCPPGQRRCAMCPSWQTLSFSDSLRPCHLSRHETCGSKGFLHQDLSLLYCMCLCCGVSCEGVFRSKQTHLWVPTR